MLWFTLLCLIASAFGVPANYNHRLPHLQYGPIPESPATTTNVFQAMMQRPTNSMENAYSSNSIENHSASSLQHINKPPSSSLIPSHESPHQPFGGQQLPQQSIISKRFFIHSAPEDDDNDDEELELNHITAGKPRINFNVVFIKEPAKSVPEMKLKLNQATNEEKTIIYVLSKKHDDSDAIDAVKVLEPQSTPSKPEVFFIRYQKPEEAEHAQRTIQTHYDNLGGGSTQISNEDVASVFDVSQQAAAQHVVASKPTMHQQSLPMEAAIFGEEIIQNYETLHDEEIREINDYLPPLNPID